MRKIAIDTYGGGTCVREKINGKQVVIARFYGHGFDDGSRDASIFLEGVRRRERLMERALNGHNPSVEKDGVDAASCKQCEDPGNFCYGCQGEGI